MFINKFIHISKIQSLLKGYTQRSTRDGKHCHKGGILYKGKNHHCQITEQVMNYSQTIKHSKYLMVFHYQKYFNIGKSPILLCNCIFVSLCFIVLVHCQHQEMVILSRNNLSPRIETWKQLEVEYKQMHHQGNRNEFWFYANKSFLIIDDLLDFRRSSCNIIQPLLNTALCTWSLSLGDMINFTVVI